MHRRLGVALKRQLHKVEHVARFSRGMILEPPALVIDGKGGPLILSEDEAAQIVALLVPLIKAFLAEPAK